MLTATVIPNLKLRPRKKLSLRRRRILMMKMTRMMINLPQIAKSHQHPLQ